MVLVSVVMSSYNHEKYIAESIESVLKQSFRDFELIITDDYSTDSSRAIIESYQRRDPRVHAGFHQKNLGITKTLNDSLDRVHGKYVCFIDSDDLWTADKLERQLVVLAEDDSKIVWSEGDIIDGQGQKTGPLFTSFLSAPANKNGRLFEPLLCEQFIALQTLIMRSEYLRNVRFDSDLKYTNDHRLLVDLAAIHEFLFMPEHLAKYRIHGGNISFKNEADWAVDKIRIRRYFLDRYSKSMSQRAKADVMYQIGFYLSRLGQKAEAKKYYLQALKTDHAHVTSALYTALALTTGEGFAGQFMLNSYNFTAGLLVLLKSGGVSFSGGFSGLGLGVGLPVSGLDGGRASAKVVAARVLE